MKIMSYKYCPRNMYLEYLIRSVNIFRVCTIHSTMERWQGKVAVVTGASSGIGANVAQKLVEEGLLVIGLARKVEPIEDLSKTLKNAPGKLYARKCDIKIAEDIINVFKWIKESIGPVQILINCAAIISPESITDGNPKSWRDILDTNLLGVVLCARQVIGQLRDSNNTLFGHIINLNSDLGHQIPPMHAPIYNLYPVVKYAITALTEILTQEMDYYKINAKITSISPGLVGKTNIFQRANVKELAPDVIANKPHLLPNDVTDSIIFALSTPAHVQIYEIMLRPIQIN